MDEGGSERRGSRPTRFVSVQEDKVATVDRNSRYRVDKSFQLYATLAELVKNFKPVLVRF